MKFVVFFLATIAAIASMGTQSVRASSGPRIEHKLGADSTMFVMSIDAKQHPKPGSTFQVTIHVVPGHDWHVYSTKMSSDGGLVPLTLKLSDTLAAYFEIENITETGDVRTAFDSNFMTVTMAHFTPYDVIADVKVLKKPPQDLPFSLLVHFQTCNEVMCTPPRTFEVPMKFLGQADITLQIAAAKLPREKNFAAIPTQ